MEEVILRDILKALQPEDLGFVNRDRYDRETIFCNTTRGGLWYRSNGEDFEDIPYNSIRGYLTEIKFEKTIRREREVWKCLFTLNCGSKNYVLETGYDTQFAKSILAAIATLDPQALRDNPVTIAPYVSTKDDKILFASVHVAGQRVKAEFSDKSDWKAISQSAINNVSRGLRGARVQNTES